MAMSEKQDKIKTALVTYFPMFIATLSLIAAIYNGYLNGKFVDLIQRNLGRTEYMRTCKEIIDAYFQVKFRAGIVASTGVGAGAPAGALSTADVEAANAVAKFGALGTYLANLRDETIRRRYTDLSQKLGVAIGEAKRTPAADLPTLFEPADRLFGELNDDCVKSAQAAPM